jgi:hypothetical protein
MLPPSTQASFLGPLAYIAFTVCLTQFIGRCGAEKGYIRRLPRAFFEDVNALIARGAPELVVLGEMLKVFEARIAPGFGFQ